jgi:single-stranded-DNA-specific exonuclease
MLTEDVLDRFVLTDGNIPGEWISLDFAEKLATEVWGQGFPEPQFSSRFKVKSQRLIKGQHLKLEVEKDGYIFDAMFFFQSSVFKSDYIDAVYSIEPGEYRGDMFVQLQIVQATESQDE